MGDRDCLPPRRGGTGGLVFVAMLAMITLTDLERRIIPNKVLIAGALICLAIGPDRSGGSPSADCGGRRGRPLLPRRPRLPTRHGPRRRQAGSVDGPLPRPRCAPAILAGLLAGSIVGLALIAPRGTDARKMTIPFGPFLALGGIVGDAGRQPAATTPTWAESQGRSTSTRRWRRPPRSAPIRMHSRRWRRVSPSSSEARRSPSPSCAASCAAICSSWTGR